MVNTYARRCRYGCKRQHLGLLHSVFVPFVCLKVSEVVRKGEYQFGSLMLAVSLPAQLSVREVRQLPHCSPIFSLIRFTSHALVHHHILHFSLCSAFLLVAHQERSQVTWAGQVFYSAFISPLPPDTGSKQRFMRFNPYCPHLWLFLVSHFVKRVIRRFAQKCSPSTQLSDSLRSIKLLIIVDHWLVVFVYNVFTKRIQFHVRLNKG